MDIILKDCSKEENKAFVLSLLFSGLLYVQTIINNYNCGDGNLCGITYRAYVNYDVEDIAGRFLIKYIAHLRSLFILGPLTVILGLVCLIIGTLLICRMLQINNTITKTIAVMTVVLYPGFADTFTFRFTADSYILAFLLSVLAVYIFGEKKSLLRGITAAILLFLTLNLYQAYFFVAVTLFVVLFLKELLNKENQILSKAIYHLLISGGVSLATLLVYLIVARMFAPTTSRLEYGVSAGVLDIIKGVGSAYVDFFKIFVGDAVLNNTWKHRGLVNLSILLLGICMSLWLLRKREKKMGPIFLYMFSLIIILPCVLNGISIINYGYVNPMMLPTIALSYTLFLALWEAFLRENMEKRTGHLFPVKVCNGCLALIMAYVMMTMVVYMGIYQMVQNYYYTKTEKIGLRIVSSLENQFPEINSNCYVYIYGGVNNDQQPEPYTVTLAGYILRGTLASNVFNDNALGYLAWNRILEDRLAVSYRMYSMTDIETYLQTEEFKTAPTFPIDGSVWKIREGCYFVKLQNP